VLTTNIVFLISILLMSVFGLYTKRVSAASTISFEGLYSNLTESRHQSSGVLLNVKGSTTPTSSVNFAINVDSQCQVKPVSSGSFGGSVNFTYNVADGLWPSYFASAAYIRATDDSVRESSQSCVMSYSISSADSEYNGLTGSKTYSIADNDQKGVTVSGVASKIEEGKITSYKMDSQGQPTSDISYTLSASGNCSLPTAQGGGKDGATTYSNFSKTKVYKHATSDSATSYQMTVYVRADDDNVHTANAKCTISGSSSSIDSRYSGLSVPKQTFTITDNDLSTTSSSSSTSSNTSTNTDSTTGETEENNEPATEVIVVDGLKILRQDGSEIDPKKKFSLTSGEAFVFEGKTKPKGKVVLTVFSEPKEYTTTADQEGDYRIEVSGLPIGEHHAEIVTTDPATGKISKPITVAQFSVVSSAINLLNNAEEIKSQGAGRSISPILIVILIVVFVASVIGGFYVYKKRRSKVSA
jgi:hypothetical protein